MDLYQQNIMEHYKAPKYQGKLEGATHAGVMANPLCGDKIDFFLRVDNKLVTKASWVGEGCVLSLATADMLAEYVQNKQFDEINKINQEWVIKSLGVTPSASRLKCALLPLAALKKAIFYN